MAVSAAGGPGGSGGFVEGSPGSPRHRGEPAEYPPEPWPLTGHNLVGVWLLPRDAAPPPQAPGLRAVTIRGRVVVSAAFFVYTEPSPLTYDEVMATQLVRDGLVPRVSITHIWVNSPASLAGGRALWAIPKDLARFDVRDDSSYDAPGIASARVARARRLPGWAPVSFTVAQDRGGRLQVSPVRGRARLSVVSADWAFDSGGPLAFLADRRPLLSLAMRPFRITFGRA